MTCRVELGWIVDVDAEAPLAKLAVELSCASPILVGSKWSGGVASRIAGQAADSAMNVVVLSPFSSALYPWMELLDMGVNASFNLFKPVGDVDVYAHFVTELLKGCLGLNGPQTAALKRSLKRVYSRGMEPTVEEVISAVEAESMDLRLRESMELLEALESMELGRLRLACSGDLELKGSSMVTLARLPPSYASAMTVAILYKLYAERFRGLLVVCHLDLLKEFLGSSWRLLLYVLAKLQEAGCSLCLPCNSVVELPHSVRVMAGLTLVGAPSTPEEARYVESLVGRAARLLDERRHAYSHLTSRGVVEIPLEELEVLELEVAKPVREGPRPMLKVKFGAKAKMAYEVLSFLRDGASTREATISYAMHRLDITSLEASRLINSLLTHGLASEVVGADGKYWVKITVRGLSAIEELEALEGCWSEG